MAILCLLVSVLGLVSAMPLVRLGRRHDPPATPIHLQFGLDPDGSYHCGDKIYSGHEIFLAAQYGINLLNADERRGKERYPQSFDDGTESRGIKFPSYCPANSMRYEFPLASGLPYNGGPDDKNAGDERIVFFYRNGDVGFDNHPVGSFCGIVTRKGAESDGFVLC
ncbi:hypothetical protein IWX90DRAFT_416208 [Phyllosticta citrichinensis]|uniref:ribonuclease T1 n=1 Tax=Phyllosticta citrichinensis TaxID=1130410 RepID=A0ABR1XS20_9PEZI